MTTVSRINRRALVAGSLALSVGLFAATTAVRAQDDPLALVEAYLAAWNAHDAEAAAAFLAEDVTYYDASAGTPLQGRGDAKTYVIDAFLDAVPDAVWAMKGEPVVQGNSVAFEWAFSGTNTGAWADGTEATGKSFILDGLSLFRIEDGQIAYQGDYYDALGFYVALGLIE